MSKLLRDAAKRGASTSLTEGAIEALGDRMADAHAAFAGAIALYRNNGVQIERFLGHKPVEAIILAGERGPESLRRAVPDADDDLVRRHAAGLAMTIYATYDGRGARRLLGDHYQELLAAVEAVRLRTGRWDALAKAVRVAGLGRVEPEMLRTDNARVRRLLRSLGAANDLDYGTIPEGVPISFQIE